MSSSPQRCLRSFRKCSDGSLLLSSKQTFKQGVANVSGICEEIEGATWVVADQRMSIEAQKKLDSTCNCVM